MKRNYLLYFTCVILLMAGCRKQQSSNEKVNQSEPAELFYGKITYSTRFESGDTVLLQTVAPFTPERIDIWFGENKFRMIEHGGASRGNILIFPNKQEAWQLDTTDKIAWLGEYSDFNDPGEELMDMMPDHFAPTLEKTSESETILGYNCDKYKVVRSGFIPSADEAFVWVTNKIRFPSSRYDVQTDINRVTVPLPLYLGYEDGVIMRMRIANKKYAAIYEITEMDQTTPGQSVFAIPEGYTKK